MRVTQALLKKYASRIGKDNFIQGYYYTPNSKKYKLAIKALTMNISNLMDKVEKQRELSLFYEANNELAHMVGRMVDKVYVDLYK